jgi:hypothetical protein
MVESRCWGHGDALLAERDSFADLPAINASSDLNPAARIWL